MWKFKMLNAGVVVWVYLFLALVNLIHPFIHNLEGGALDALLPYLDGIAMRFGFELPHLEDH